MGTLKFYGGKIIKSWTARGKIEMKMQSAF